MKNHVIAFRGSMKPRKVTEADLDRRIVEMRDAWSEVFDEVAMRQARHQSLWLRIGCAWTNFWRLS
jgi:hypothetical protein